MNKEAMYSTGKDDWETPGEVFEPLNQEFHFTLDACANEKNAKCKRYYTIEQDGLKQDWQGETVWCNPPYSKGRQDAWVKKCWEESRKPDTTVVMLIPARTDTDRFHRYIWEKEEVRFLPKRICFLENGKPRLDKKGRPMPAPFPSMVVVFRRDSAK